MSAPGPIPALSPTPAQCGLWLRRVRVLKKASEKFTDTGGLYPIDAWLSRNPERLPAGCAEALLVVAEGLKDAAELDPRDAAFLARQKSEAENLAQELLPYEEST